MIFLIKPPTYWMVKGYHQGYTFPPSPRWHPTSPPAHPPELPSLRTSAPCSFRAAMKATRLVVHNHRSLSGQKPSFLKMGGTPKSSLYSTCFFAISQLYFLLIPYFEKHPCNKCHGFYRLMVLMLEKWWSHGDTSEILKSKFSTIFQPAQEVQQWFFMMTHPSRDSEISGNEHEKCPKHQVVDWF